MTVCTGVPDMCGMLLRFRTYYIAILADIEKAFLQIGIQEHERDITLLRRDNSDITTMICDNIYVDNLSVGATSIEKACVIHRKAKAIFKGALMNLTEWSSNCDVFLDCLPKVERSKGTVMKVFGLLWDTVFK